MKPLNINTQDLMEVFKKIIATDSATVINYVDNLRKLNPGIGNEQLAKKIIGRKSMKNGLVGAVTGIPGLLLLPVTIPADLVASWRIQAAMVFSIAYVYGNTPENSDLITDFFILLAEDTAKETLKDLV